MPDLEKTDSVVPFKISVQLTPGERDEFRRFLKKTGRKAGPWVYSKIHEALDEHGPKGAA